MNLAEQQWDLLRLLVEKHQKHGGQSFIATHASEGLGLTYSARDSTYVPYSYLDLQQLNREGLVSLNEVGSNQLSGQLTELGIRLGTAVPAPQPGEEKRPAREGPDSAIWRRIREDFESLPSDDWSLIWSSRRPVGMFIKVQLQSQWSWFRPTDAGLRARASAIFLKAAKARGYDSEDQWLEELRYADFVEFQNNGQEIQEEPDGTFRELESGVLNNAVNHSITLCHQLEAGGIPKPIIARLANEAVTRMEAATAAFTTGFLKKAESEVPKLEAKPDRRIREAELLRELVIHNFETAARECMALYDSLSDFETALRAEIARFVQFNVGQHRWLGDAMRNELYAGFMFFTMRANPWAGIAEAQRASKWHLGAITGEALAATAVKLATEAAAHLAQRGKADADAKPAMENTVSVPPFPNRAAWLKARLAERDWSKHNLGRQGGPEHRTTQKILDGSHVLDDVLRKVIIGLQSKPTHKGRQLPAIVESDIPTD